KTATPDGAGRTPRHALLRAYRAISLVVGATRRKSRAGCNAQEGTRHEHRAQTGCQTRRLQTQTIRRPVPDLLRAGTLRAAACRQAAGDMHLVLWTPPGPTRRRREVRTGRRPCRVAASPSGA